MCACQLSSQVVGDQPRAGELLQRLQRADVEAQQRVEVVHRRDERRAERDDVVDELGMAHGEDAPVGAAAAVADHRDRLVVALADLPHRLLSRPSAFSEHSTLRVIPEPWTRNP